MAKTIEQQMEDAKKSLYAEKGLLEERIHELNQLLENDIEDEIRNQYERELKAKEHGLDEVTDKIKNIKLDQQDLEDKKQASASYKWAEVEGDILSAARLHHMSYNVENNKFIYCMNMAEEIEEEKRHDGIVNPQFRSCDATRIENVLGKVIDRFIPESNFRIKKLFHNKRMTHFQETASFLWTKWCNDKVYNKARIISNFWVEPDFENYESYDRDLDILLYCVAGGKQENIDHLEIWPNYKYLFPERVANTPNLDICGPNGANGKGRYLELCKTIFTYGCVTPAAAKELADGFNGSWEMSTIIYFDEPTEKELPEGKVKNATGGEEQRVERKGIDAYTADRNFSVMALSNNELGVFKLSGGGMASVDRRFSVVSTNIVLIDEIMRRENITKEQATVRVNEIAQKVKDRKIIAKWMAHCILKHDITNMKILPALHGQDYHARFEAQKNTMDMIFDKLIPILQHNKLIPVSIITDTVNALLSDDKKRKLASKTVTTKFKTYLDRYRIPYVVRERVRVRMLWNNEEDISVNTGQCNVIALDDTTDSFDYSTISNEIYRSNSKLTKETLVFGLD